MDKFFDVKNLLSNKYKRELLKPFLLSTIKDVSQFSHQVMREFYDDYKPISYKRKYGILSPFNIKTSPSKEGWTITFTYSASSFTRSHDFISPNIGGEDKIFQATFINGYHGGIGYWHRPWSQIPRQGRGASSHNASPWGRIRKYVYSKYK